MRKKESKKDIFFPYYVNQGRLLDIYAILNRGYSDYEEVSQNTSEGSESKIQGCLSASTGFKLLKISSNFSGDVKEHGDFSNIIKTKKVQTITSILSMVLSELKDKNYLKKIETSQAGNFVVIPVVLQINSLKNILDEVIEIIDLVGDISKLGIDTKIKSADISSYKKIANSLKTFVNGEEIIYECNNYAITGNILEKHYYQGSKTDIIDTKIMCFAQVKKVFPNGTELMKDNKLGVFKDASIKNAMIECVKSANEGNQFSFSSIAVPEIKGKPVYKIEIIALYQVDNME